MKDELKYLNKFKKEEKIDYNTVPAQMRERSALSQLAYIIKKTTVIPNKEKYKIKRFNKIVINGLSYHWGYGSYNYDGEYNWRVFIFDDDGRKIYNKEPLQLDDLSKNDIKEIILSII